MINLIFALFFIKLVICNPAELPCDLKQKPLEVTVLYESLCPHSKTYLKDLKEDYPIFENCIVLTYVPYGKARSKNNKHICQHGPKECSGNLLQNCALHAIPDQKTQLEYLNCHLKNFSAVLDRKCAKDFGVEDLTQECFTNPTIGLLYQAEAEQITLKYAFNFIPAIVYDGVFDIKLQKEAREDIPLSICKKLIETKRLENIDCMEALN